MTIEEVVKKDPKGFQEVLETRTFWIPSNRNIFNCVNTSRKILIGANNFCTYKNPYGNLENSGKTHYV